MSFSISAVAPSDLTYNSTPTEKQPARPSEAAQIKQLASEGHSAQTIAASIGLPESLVASELGTTATSSSTKSQATAVLSLSARLSVHA